MKKKIAVVGGGIMGLTLAYELIKKVGLDLIPKMRLVILRRLYEKRATEINCYWLKTTNIAKATGIHGKTTLRTLQDLCVIGLVRWQQAEDETGQPYEWQLTEKALESIGGAEIFSEYEGENV